MESSALPVLVVGVGYVGRRLLDAFPDGKGFGLSRSGTGPADRIRKLDLDEDDVAPIDSPASSALVYTVPPAARGNERGNEDTRLETFLRRLALVPRRFVYLSTTGVYGNRDGARVDETAAVAPESARAKRRVFAERCLQSFCERASIDLVILRVPGIYGPGRLGIDRIRNREPVLDAADSGPGNRIHVDDLVQSCIAALADDVPAGIYNVGDGDERSASWFAGEVARQLGLPAPPAVSRQRAEDTFSARRLSFLRESRRVDVTRMRETLNSTLKYPDAADGIAASLREDPA